jgi:hypothetical protein
MCKSDENNTGLWVDKMKKLTIRELLYKLEWRREDPIISKRCTDELHRRAEQGKKATETLAQITAAIAKSVDYTDLGIMVTEIMAERQQ